MRKKILIILFAALLVITSVVMVSGFMSKASPVSAADIKLTDLSIDSVASVVNKKFDNDKMIKSAENIASIINCHNEAKYYNICAYIEFIGENSFTSEQIKIINNILEKGTTIQTLSQVYDFWLTTNEPFEIIEEICSMEDAYFSEFWYENAFNKLTDNKHGVLDIEDVEEYKAKGISSNQILAGNILCRKGVYTINEILDKVVKGANIEEIACEIYSIDALPEGENIFQRVNMISKAKKYNISSLILGNTPEKIKNAIEKANASFSNVISQKIESEIKRLKISIPKSDNKEAVEKMNDIGLPIDTLHALLNKGYTPDEIVKASEIGIDDIFEATKKAREVLKNE